MAGRACFHGRAGLHLSQCQHGQCSGDQESAQHHGGVVPDDRREYANFAQELAKFEAKAGVSVLDDITAPLGGEVAATMDGPMLPTRVGSWFSRFTIRRLCNRPW